MDFADRDLKCIHCGAECVFTAGKQFSFTRNNSRTYPNTANNTGQNPTMVYHKLFALSPRQHALSADREQRFPSCLSRAGRCCVAHPSRTRYRLQLFDAEQIAARNIGPDVGKVQNNRPDLIVPFELDDPGGPPLRF
jgi:hypothetical protein